MSQRYLDKDGSFISPQVLDGLLDKLYQERTVWADNATIAFFALNMELLLSRAFAAYLTDIVKAIKPGLKNSERDGVVKALIIMAEFIFAIMESEDDVENNDAVNQASQEFDDVFNYPADSNPPYVDITAGFQRISTKAALEQVLALVGNALNDFQDLENK